jgi:hypothetical protein
VNHNIFVGGGSCFHVHSCWLNRLVVAEHWSAYGNFFFKNNVTVQFALSIDSFLGYFSITHNTIGWHYFHSRTCFKIGVLTLKSCCCCFTN